MAPSKPLQLRPARDRDGPELQCSYRVPNEAINGAHITVNNGRDIGKAELLGEVISRPARLAVVCSIMKLSLGQL